MTADILKNSVAESVRYLQAYGEERLRDAENMWNSMGDDELSEIPDPHTEPIDELPPSSTLPQATAARPAKLTPSACQPSRSILQRLLGW